LWRDQIEKTPPTVIFSQRKCLLQLRENLILRSFQDLAILISVGWCLLAIDSSQEHAQLSMEDLTKCP